ncbi:MAG: uridine kinase [Erysipelotrichaceae bacterium]
MEIRDVNQANINDAERNFDNSLNQVVKNIITSKCKIVYLAGPSSSGKTTTAKYLTNKLTVQGYNAVYISLDNFYHNRVDIQTLANGVKDLESIKALDSKAFEKVVNNLLNGEACEIPKYDFSKGERSSETIKFAADEERICIFEGIHALNPLLMGKSEKSSYKIYISVATDVYDGVDLWLDQTQIRLMRRFIRDFYHRNSSLEYTLSLWQGVLLGELNYITPFIDRADVKINSFHDYELKMIKAEMLILAQNQENKQVNDLLEKLEAFNDLSKELLPKTSLLNEFLK